MKVKNPTINTQRRRPFARLACGAVLGALVLIPSLLQAAGAAPEPSVCLRSCWNAHPANLAPDEGVLDRAVIHHTAGTYYVNNIEDSKAVVKAIQEHHMWNNGWRDIGYHYLVDRLGNVFEGRRQSHNKSVVRRGAHDGVNSRSFGYSVMGNYNTHTFTQASRDALWSIIAWRMPNGWSPYGSSSYSWLSNIGHVSSHRNVSSTACPGDNVYATIGTNFSGGEARDAINSLIQGGNNRLDVVVRGDGNNVYWRYYWENNGGWSNWTNIGGGAQGKPAISSRGPGQLEVFIRGGANDINWKSYQNGSWSGWGSLGGDVRSAPGAVSRSPDRINVVVRNPSNNVIQKWWTSSGGWVSNWQNLGGGTSQPPTISSRDENSLDVFIRGGAGDLNWRPFTTSSGWGNWQGLGGDLGSGPTAVSRSSNRINVFARESGGVNIIQRWYVNGSWYGWQDLGGATTQEPGVASWGSDHLALFIRGGGGDINRKTFTGSWSGWSSLGGDWSSGPEAVGGQW